MDEEAQREKCRDYTAIVQTNIARMLCGYFGAEWPLPDYTEFMYPKKVAKKQTFQEIRDHILKRLAE